MKKMLLLTSLLLSQVSFAAISESKLELRHQALIENAIDANCGSFRELTEVNTSEVVIQIDQGIRDIKYTTVLTGLQRMDQNIFDRFAIIVESEYADMYDHSTQNWGAYSVTKVSCRME
jgi:VIT1/CCC1 family predicted Fe2+/Mn2+ transporter